MQKSLLFAAICGPLLTGCASVSSEVDEAATAGELTKPELHEILVGNTFPFSEGGMYFSSQTDATILWGGQMEDVQWYANDNSEFCYTASLFGGSEECLGLRSTGAGDYVRTFEGKSLPVKAADIKEGKAF